MLWLWLTLASLAGFLALLALALYFYYLYVKRRFLPHIGIGRVNVDRHTLTFSISSRFICTNCCSVSVKISVSRRTRNGTRES